MPKRSTLRASDEDRERIADRLRDAAGEGRLRAEELEERLGDVFAARTYGQLSVLVADLPTPREKPRGHVIPFWLRACLVVAAALGALVAVAIAAAVLVALASLWFVWLLVGWSMFGRGHHVRLARHTRTLASAARYARTSTGVSRGGRASI